jgi:hypothetical protein
VPETSEVEVTVRDEGIGIAPADVERVFERFVQGEAGDRRRFGGIGLGLYIVRQLARAQGGEVTAAPAPGGGTIMSLRLPRVNAAASATAVANGADVAEGDTGTKESRDVAEPAAAGTQAARTGEAENDADEAPGSGSETAQGSEAPEPGSAESDEKARARGRRRQPLLTRLPRPRTTTDRGASRNS